MTIFSYQTKKKVKKDCVPPAGPKTEVFLVWPQKSNWGLHKNAFSTGSLYMDHAYTGYKKCILHDSCLHKETILRVDHQTCTLILLVRFGHGICTVHQSYKSLRDRSSITGRVGWATKW